MNDENDTGALTLLPASELSLVAQLAAQLSAKAREIEAAEAQLKVLKAAHEELQIRRLPDAMLDLGVKSLKLTDGATITVKPEYHASIPKAQRETALAWLREHEFGDLIKNEITVTFGKGED